MDYKYIEQLLERYWECQATLEEEAILRAFFAQDDVPASLLKYRDLFLYEQQEISSDILGEDFDHKVLSQISEERPVKARVVKFTQRLRPLYKAVAIVAVVLTLSNAIQMSIDAHRSSADIVEMSSSEELPVQVAQTDTIEVDSVQHTSLAPQELIEINQMGNEILPKN